MVLIKWPVQPNSNRKLINKMLEDTYKPFGEEECLDVFTHYAAMNYLQTKKPKVLYILMAKLMNGRTAGNTGII